MRKILASGVAAAALLGLAGFTTAQAAPTLPNPPATIVGQNILAGGTTVTAAFLFVEAGDTSELEVSVNLGPNTVLFNNQASPVGSTQSFGANVGDPLTFTLANLTQGTSFTTGIGSTNVAYLNSSDIATIEAALNIDISAAGEAAIAALALIGNVTIIAFEDRVVGNTPLTDFNDLVFAFAPIFASVPEPASLALLGAGLIGLGVAARRRRAV